MKNKKKTIHNLFTWSINNFGLKALQVGIVKWLLEVVFIKENFPPNLQKGMKAEGLILSSKCTCGG